MNLLEENGKGEGEELCHKKFQLQSSAASLALGKQL